MTLSAVAFYGLEVPAGDIVIPATPDFPATVRYLPHNTVMHSLSAQLRDRSAVFSSSIYRLTNN